MMSNFSQSKIAKVVLKESDFKCIELKTVCI